MDTNMTENNAVVGNLYDIKLHNSDFDLGASLRQFLYDTVTDKGLYLVDQIYVKLDEGAVKLHFKLSDFDDSGEDEFAVYIYDNTQVVINKYNTLYLVIDIKYLEESLRKDIHDIYNHFINIHNKYDGKKCCHNIM